MTKKNENFPRSRKSQGNSIAIVKVSERSENLLVKQMPCAQNPAKSGKRLKMRRKISMACKKAKENVNMGCFSLIKGQ